MGRQEFKGICHKLVFATGLQFLLAFAGEAARAAPVSTVEEEHRSTYRQAEKAFKLGDQTQFSDLSHNLRTYPLYQYLVYKDLVKRLNSMPYEDINLFLNYYGSSPLSKKLRTKWLSKMAEIENWTAYLQAYHPKSANTKQQCLYVKALFALNKQTKAESELKKLWLVGKSQPEECDPLFNNWKKSGGLTNELIWQRMELAYNANNPALASYLNRQLSGAYAEYGQKWVSIHENPIKLNNKSLNLDTLPIDKQAAIYSHGISRLGKNNPKLAHQILDQKQFSCAFTQEQIIKSKKAIARGYIRKHPKQAASHIQRLGHQDSYHHLIEYQLRRILKTKDFNEVKNWYASLPPSLQNTPIWQYWYARALEEEGNLDAANKIYNKLSNDRDYYSYLAADKVKKPKQLQHRTLPITTEELQVVKNHPGIIRAKELYALNKTLDAKREWYHAINNFNNKQRYIAAKLAQSWGWHQVAVFTATKQPHLDDLSLRFPVVYKDIIEKHAKDRNLSPALILAMMRQESLFMPTATSHAGAKGLMQLMPQTALQVSNQLSLPAPTTQHLYDPKRNIQLGTAYLDFMLDEFAEHPALAVASYNAGPHRVVRWLPKSKSMDADLWIETVPFKETRKYVKRVYTYTIIYQNILGYGDDYTPYLKSVPSKI